MKSQFNSKGLEITGIQSGLADCAGSAAPEKRESVRDRSETDGGGEKSLSKQMVGVIPSITGPTATMMGETAALPRSPPRRSFHSLLTVIWMNAPAETPRRKKTCNCGIKPLLPLPWRQ